MKDNDGQETQTMQPTVALMTAQRIAGDVVNRATADLPDNQRSAIRRLHAYYVENNLSTEEVGKLIGYSTAVVGLIFRGKYEGNLENVVKEIETFFNLEDRRAQGRRLHFIETRLTRRIWKLCDAALEYQKMAFIFGDMQIGKTEALKAYREAHNHGSTIYVQMPTGGTLGNFLMELARALRIGEQLTHTRIRERIKAAFDDRMLLIVDELHRAIPQSHRSMRPVDSVEFIREIFDETQCGVVLCATNVFRDAMEQGHLHKVLRQTKRRRLCSLQLKNVPDQDDLDCFAAAYGLEPSSGKARDLEKAMVQDEALGMWLTLLRMGAKLAARTRAKMAWNHVLLAHRGLMELEGRASAARV